MLNKKQKSLLKEVKIRYSLVMEPVARHVLVEMEKYKTTVEKIDCLKSAMLAAITSALEDEREGVDFIEQDKEGLNN
jgi:hypothetical protein